MIENSRLALIPQNRRKQGRFAKGRSGNPGGRPKEFKEFKEWCRQVMDEAGGPDAPSGREALLKLAHRGKDDKVRLAAWRVIVEYAYGKAPESVKLENEGKLEIQVRYADTGMAG